MTSPSIAVIIPCYNETNALFTCVKSIMEQSCLPNEIIIIDDASNNPATSRVLAEIEVMDNIRVLYQKKNTGPGIARNIGIQSSHSEWMLLLDSDDILLEGAIEQLQKAIVSSDNADFFFWNYCLNDIAKKSKTVISTQMVCRDDSSELDPYKLARNFIIPGCSPYKKEMWQAIEGYDPELSKGGVEDIDFWRRAIMQGAKGIHIDATLYQWNRQETGNNSNIYEEKYFLHRRKMLPYYDKYNPEQAREIRPYIYRYYSARLMAAELNAYLKMEAKYFSFVQHLKGKLMYLKSLYILSRKIKNNFRK